VKAREPTGSLGASMLLSVIGDAKDFHEEGMLASYFGIVPRVRSSNQTEHSGQCALIAKRYSPYLDRFYERIRAASEEVPMNWNKWVRQIHRRVSIFTVAAVYVASWRTNMIV
jgi:transposase